MRERIVEERPTKYGKRIVKQVNGKILIKKINEETKKVKEKTKKSRSRKK